MDIKVFTEILKDKHFPYYKKLKYKYGADFDSFLKTLEELYYKPLPLYDFDDHNIVFTEAFNAVKGAKTLSLTDLEKGSDMLDSLQRQHDRVRKYSTIYSRHMGA